MNLLTTKDAADKLDVTPSRIRQFILEGRLPARKIGRDLFIKPGDLKKLTRKKMGRPPKEVSK